METFIIHFIIWSGVAVIWFAIDTMAYTRRIAKQNKRKVTPGYYPFLTKEQVN